MSLADFARPNMTVDALMRLPTNSARRLEELSYQGAEKGISLNQLQQHLAQRIALHNQLEGLMKEGRAARLNELGVCQDCEGYYCTCPEPDVLQIEILKEQVSTEEIPVSPDKREVA